MLLRCYVSHCLGKGCRNTIGPAASGYHHADVATRQAQAAQGGMVPQLDAELAGLQATRQRHLGRSARPQSIAERASQSVWGRYVHRWGQPLCAPIPR